MFKLEKIPFETIEKNSVTGSHMIRQLLDIATGSQMVRQLLDIATGSQMVRGLTYVFHLNLVTGSWLINVTQKIKQFI